MELNHFNKKGDAVMVDVSTKAATFREAEAQGYIAVPPNVLEAIQTGTAKKGDVLGVARIAGIMGVKKTAELIPLCHTLVLSGCAVDFEIEETRVKAVCTVKCQGQTGVEMEALTGVSVSLLTIYDMCKALSKEMVIEGICLVMKDGGKSGRYERFL